MGHVGSKTRSLGQILHKPRVRCRCHIFSPIIIKISQDVCLDEIWDESKHWSCLIKNYVAWSNLRKTMLHSRGHIFSQIIMKPGQNVCLDQVLDEFEIGSCVVKN